MEGCAGGLLSKMCDSRGRAAKRPVEKHQERKLTNAGKKEQEQINQLLQKQAREGRETEKEVEARTVPKQHKLKGQIGK